MRLVDARRLTGPSHLAAAPLVLVEVALEAGERLDDCLAAYRTELARMRSALGLAPHVEPMVAEHRGGAFIGYEAPIDTMLALAELSEWAAESAALTLASREPLPLEPKQSELSALLAELANPPLLLLAAEAKRRGLACLWDDELVSVGLGRRSVSFARGAIPAPEAIAWEALGAIPVAMITGTNGKTTSARLLGRVATEAGFVVGSTSSDGITVGGRLVEQGDWTGPAAARAVLRDRAVELAVLETARGGILRRGLALDACDVALLTNVSADHLGLDGVDDTVAMTRVKAVVARAAGPRGTVVLGAHDQNLVALAGELTASVTYFADLERGDAFAAGVIERHQRDGRACVIARGGHVVYTSGDQEVVLTPLEEVPLTVGGRARYNVENVLGVVAVARALRLDDAAIARGLRGFAVADNPGRGQLVERRGVSIMLDFGHNPEGMRAVLGLVTALRAGGSGKFTVIAGSAGDRSDGDIEAMASAILEAKPSRVFLRDLPGYLRGRGPGEVSRVFEAAFRERGFPEDRVTIADSEVDALERALGESTSGDFVVLLAHLERAAVGEILARP